MKIFIHQLCSLLLLEFIKNIKGHLCFHCQIVNLATVCLKSRTWTRNSIEEWLVLMLMYETCIYLDRSIRSLEAFDLKGWSINWYGLMQENALNVWVLGEMQPIGSDKTLSWAPLLLIFWLVILKRYNLLWESQWDSPGSSSSDALPYMSTFQQFWWYESKSWVQNEFIEVTVFT